MKTVFYTAAALAALLFPACTVDGDAVPEKPAAPAAVTLSVCLDGPVTKAKLSAGNADDMNFHNAQIFVYNKLGVLEAKSGRVDTREGINLSIIPGQKTVWAIVNAPELQLSLGTSDLPGDMRSLLSDNMLNSLVMSGSKELEVKTSMSVSVDVKHIAAKIVLDKVTRDFTDPNLEEVPMRLKKIYVSNVAADCDYACSGGTPTIWNNQLGVLGTTPENAALLVDGGLDEDLGEGKTYSTAHTFYVYPNPVTADKTDNIWSPRKTRLVLECDYNGRTCYYPVTIPGENYDVGAGTSPDIQRNKVYHINALTLKRPGSQNTESKEPPVQSDVSCTFSVSVADWEDDIPYTEVF